MTSNRPHTAPLPAALEARFALRAAAHLTAEADALPQDITERLRVAREQAVARARASRRAAAPVTAGSQAGPTLTWPGAGSDGGGGWWTRLGALVPLVALVGGLVLIQDWHGSNQIAAAAEIDSALLADDLPPSAYSDPGFVEFLKSPQD